MGPRHARRVHTAAIDECHAAGGRRKRPSKDDRRPRREQEDKPPVRRETNIDRTLDESFPASDPPGWSGGRRPQPLIPPKNARRA